MRILNDITLKNGNHAKIFHNNGLTECRATKLILDASIELIQNNFTASNSISIYNMAEVIWAEVDNEPVGGIVYHKFNFIVLQNWILLSFTDSAWRRLGVNNACHVELERLSLESGIENISSMVHVNNIARLKSCEGVGMKGDLIRMTKRLTEIPR